MLEGFICNKTTYKGKRRFKVFIDTYKSSLFSGGRGFPGSKQLAVLPRIRNGGCFGDRAEGAEGA